MTGFLRPVYSLSKPTASVSLMPIAHLFIVLNVAGKATSIFALLNGAVSGSEQRHQRFEVNAGKERPMQPCQHVVTMATLDLTPSVAYGDRALPGDVQAMVLFLAA